MFQAFSEVGRVIKVRMVTDAETGKPRGFAFIEFEEPEAALSAIRNMNEYELNGRRLRVNFSNSSHLEDLADKLGMDLSQQTQRASTSAASKAGPGTSAIADALKAMSKAEMYDVVAKFKEIADRDPDEARRLLSGHPQLPEAMLFLMSKLDMVQTPVTTDGGSAGLAASNLAPPSRAADPRARMDPRAATSAPVPADPRSAQAAPRADPRSRVDPRAVRAPPPPPPMMPRQQQYQPPPPPPMQQNSTVGAPGVANLDPALVQRKCIFLSAWLYLLLYHTYHRFSLSLDFSNVLNPAFFLSTVFQSTLWYFYSQTTYCSTEVMSLTPQQIAQLPPDKQQSILALRQQITGGR